MGETQNLIDELLREAGALSIDVQLEQSLDWQNKLTRFFGELHASFWWEHLKGAVSIQDEDAWMELDSLRFQPFLWMGPEHDLFVGFNSGAELVRVLGEMPPFEFYVVDKEATAVLCFNHHDFAIGAGAGREFVKQLLERRKTQYADG